MGQNESTNQSIGVTENSSNQNLSYDQSSTNQNLAMEESNNKPKKRFMEEEKSDDNVLQTRDKKIQTKEKCLKIVDYAANEIRKFPLIKTGETYQLKQGSNTDIEISELNDGVVNIRNLTERKLFLMIKEQSPSSFVVFNDIQRVTKFYVGDDYWAISFFPSTRVIRNGNVSKDEVRNPLLSLKTKVFIKPDSFQKDKIEITIGEAGIFTGKDFSLVRRSFIPKGMISPETEDPKLYEELKFISRENPIRIIFDEKEKCVTISHPEDNIFIYPNKGCYSLYNVSIYVDTGTLYGVLDRFDGKNKIGKITSLNWFITDCDK